MAYLGAYLDKIRRHATRGDIIFLAGLRAAQPASTLQICGSYAYV